MKIRDSGMPERAIWEGFFDPLLVLRRLAFTSVTGDVADLGCGYGTFSLAAAQLTPARVHAFDVEPDMIAATAGKALELGFANVHALVRDLAACGTGLPDGAVAYAMLFNVLHAEEAAGLLHEASRILCPGGALGIIHWVHDAATPRGPALAIRPRPEQCAAWALQAGLEPAGAPLALPPFHYGLVARKPVK